MGVHAFGGTTVRGLATGIMLRTFLSSSESLACMALELFMSTSAVGPLTAPSRACDHKLTFACHPLRTQAELVDTLVI